MWRATFSGVYLKQLCSMPIPKIHSIIKTVQHQIQCLTCVVSYLITSISFTLILGRCMCNEVCCIHNTVKSQYFRMMHYMMHYILWCSQKTFLVPDTLFCHYKFFKCMLTSPHPPPHPHLSFRWSSYVESVQTFSVFRNLRAATDPTHLLVQNNVYSHITS